jgi:hypothetical protein
MRLRANTAPPFARTLRLAAQLEKFMNSRFPISGWAAALLLILNNLESLAVRMLIGIRRFLVELMPEWIGRQLVNLSRVAVKAVRVAAVFGVWFAVTCFPFCVLVFHRSWLPSGGFVVLLVLAWTFLTLGGSWWGAVWVRRRNEPPPGH